MMLEGEGGQSLVIGGSSLVMLEGEGGQSLVIGGPSLVMLEGEGGQSLVIPLFTLFSGMKRRLRVMPSAPHRLAASRHALPGHAFEARPEPLFPRPRVLRRPRVRSPSSLVRSLPDSQY